MVIFNALLNLSELKELYSGNPVCVCPLYKGVINALKTFEAAGNPITIPEYKSLVKLTTSFSPKQAGTGDPSLANVRPISGYDGVTVTRCGKNLADYTKAQPWTDSQTVEIIPNGVKWSGNYYFQIPITGLPKASTVVCAYTSEVAGTWRIEYSDKTLTLKSKNGVPITLEPNKSIKSLYIYSSTPEEVVTDAIFTNIQLEFGSTPTSYEPYQPGTTAQLSLPETIYGGTVDAVTGVGEKTWEFVEFDGTENWEMNSNNIVLYNAVSAPANTNPGTGYCSHLPFAYNFGGDNIFISVVTIYLGTALSAKYTLESWKSYLASQASAGTPVQVAYKLATPNSFKVSQVTIPSLKGENYFFTNGENMDIIYKKEFFWSDEA